MAKFGLSLEGVDGVMAALKDKMRQYPDAAAFALYRAGVRIHGPAVKKAPVQHGVLRSSAYVSSPYQSNGGTTVEMGFGTKYAARQHEELAWIHPRGGEARYLSKAVSEQLGSMLARMAADIDEAVKTGAKFGESSGIPTRPTIKAGKRGEPKKTGNRGRARFKRQRANVKGKTGR